MPETVRPSLFQDGYPLRWLVTIRDRHGADVCLEIEASDESAAREEALEWHPLGRVLAVEASC